jgi:hypothetical protein
MKQSAPARSKAPGARDPGHHTQTDLRVRYYQRMRVQRVYPLVVEVRSGAAARPAGGLTLEPVAVRPLIPGAQVVPAEQRLDVTRPGDKATFFVTPLARGRFPEPRVVVLQHGRAVHAIPLRMKAVTQRFTWLLLLLTVLLTAGVFYYTHVNKLTGKIPYTPRHPNLGEGVKKQGEEEKAKPEDQNKKENNQGAKDGEKGAALLDLSKLLVRADDQDKKTDQPGAKDSKGKKNDDKAAQDKAQEVPKPPKVKDEEPDKKDDKGEQPPAGQGPPGRGGRGGPGRGTGPRPGGSGGGPPPGVRGAGPGMPGLPQPPPPSTAATDNMVGGSPGDVLEYKINQEVKEDLGDLGYVSDKVVPQFSAGVAWVYDYACNMPSAYICFGLVMLALTAISWFLHRPRRGSGYARLELSLAPASAHAQETLPLNPPEGRPLDVEPA